MTIPGDCVVTASSCPAGWGVVVVARDPDSMAPDPESVLMQSKEGQHSPSMEKGVHFMSEGGGGHSVGHSTAEIIEVIIMHFYFNGHYNLLALFLRHNTTQQSVAALSAMKFS